MYAVIIEDSICFVIDIEEIIKLIMWKIITIKTTTTLPIAYFLFKLIKATGKTVTCI